MPEELDEIMSVAPFYAAFSPNLLEMQSLLSIPPTDRPTRADVINAAEAFHDLVAETGKPTPAVIIRAGEMGSYTLSDGWKGWVAAYWGKEEQTRVVDVTGGGNAYLGGLCAGLLLSHGDFRIGQQNPRHFMVIHEDFNNRFYSFYVRLDRRVLCHRATGSASTRAYCR